MRDDQQRQRRFTSFAVMVLLWELRLVLINSSDAPLRIVSRIFGVFVVRSIVGGADELCAIGNQHHDWHILPKCR